MNVLFLNHNVVKCGVYQYGRRVYDILQPMGWFTYREVGTVEEYLQAVKEKSTWHAIFYNYNRYTMKWLNESTIQKEYKNIAIVHESNTDLFDSYLSLNPEDSWKYIVRPLFENVRELLASHPISKDSVREFIESGRDTPDVPIFGSFGFSLSIKGFDDIVKLVNAEYDQAIIKFVCPKAYFDPSRKVNYKNTVSQCKEQITKPGIKLMITDEFFETTDLLHFLSSTTANLFFYDTLERRSISSVTDYALSVDTPLLLNDSVMFRHIYRDDLNPFKSSIAACIEKSPAICKELRSVHTNKSLIGSIQWSIIKPMTNSQAWQDLFVLRILNFKQNGRFVEIGSNHHSVGNNSYLLEKRFNWTGLLVEYDASFAPKYKLYRSASQFIIDDARKIDYAGTLASWPADIDYLQIDLDVDNRSTLDTLELFDRTVFDNHRFAVVTFETDIYRGDYFNTRAASRAIFEKRGYVRLFGDVMVKQGQRYDPFEDWWVHPALVNPKWLAYATDTSLYSAECVQRLLGH